MSLFEPRFDTILKHLNSGDFTIAKKLYDETINNILLGIEDEALKKQFKDLSEFPYKSGNWAIERTILSSMMEAQKASVLMSLNYLKIFGDMEFVKTKFTSGPNPEVDPTSFISTSRRLTKKIPKEYEGSFSSVDPGKMPNKILLGKYHENGSKLEPSTSEKSGKVWIGQWPQYRSFEQYEIVQIDSINDKLSDFEDDSFKQDLITKRSENLRSEYTELDNSSQLKDHPNGIRSGLRKYFRHRNVTNQDGKVVLVSVEEDYDIEVIVLKVSETRYNDDGSYSVSVDHHLVEATLKPDLKPGSDPLIKEDGTRRYTSNTISGSTSIGISSYISRLFPVLLEDGVLTLVELGVYISKINNILGEIISKRISNEFEFMDPEIAKLPDDDELKVKYYLDNVMIFDGSTKFSNNIVDLVFSIKDSIPVFKERGTISENDDQMKFSNIIISYMSIVMNTYIEMLDYYKTFLLKSMTPTSITTLYTEHSQMTWLKSMVTKNNILKYLGSTDNTIYTTSLFESVVKDWPKEDVQKQVDFYEELINKYIEQVSAVYNINLSKISLK